MPFVSTVVDVTPTTTLPTITSSTTASTSNAVPLGSKEAILYVVVAVLFVVVFATSVFFVRSLVIYLRLKAGKIEEKDLESQGGVKESAATRLRLKLRNGWGGFFGWFMTTMSGFLKKNSPIIEQQPPQPFKFRRRRRSSLVGFIYHLPRISPFRIEIEAWKQRLRESRDPIQYRWYINYEDVLTQHEEKLRAEAPMELYYLRIKLLRKLRIRKEKAERMGIVPELAMPKGVSRAPSADLYPISEVLAE
ncbi:hypothetical protein HGRIS_010722 [Hohenbuehelia grisea]|uniref:Uncharacterized protein n=1 Tax=Hohenbuehelia grisea TaxID=104357 RepID=A0ABR3IXP4_9AGAR